MTRRLVPLKRAVKDAEERGEDLDDLFIDPDDIVTLEEGRHRQNHVCIHRRGRHEVLRDNDEVHLVKGGGGAVGVSQLVDVIGV